MGWCREIEKRIHGLARMPAAQVPLEVQEHVAKCSACSQALSAARVAQGLLAAAAETPEPSGAFTGWVLAALPETRPSRPEAEMWRLGWGLVPAFAAMVAVLGVLYQYQASAVAFPTGLVPQEMLSAGERLVIETSLAELDTILDVVMEGGGR